MQNYYTQLGVDKNASLDEIKKAYLKQLKKYHPDVYSGDSDYAQKKTAELNVIYGTLKDKKQRQKYDLETFGPPKTEHEELMDQNLFSQMIIRLRKGMSSNKTKKQKEPLKENKKEYKKEHKEETKKQQDSKTQNALVKVNKKEKEHKVLNEEQKEKVRLYLSIGIILSILSLIILLCLIL